jgi:hypothetical protein
MGEKTWTRDSMHKRKNPMPALAPSNEAIQLNFEAGQRLPQGARCIKHRVSSSRYQFKVGSLGAPRACMRNEIISTCLAKTTPVGFEPTRGDPIGLAGRRLNRSAKVSLYDMESLVIT